MKQYSFVEQLVCFDYSFVSSLLAEAYIVASPLFGIDIFLFIVE
jgi:hypothetical protein